MSVTTRNVLVMEFTTSKGTRSIRIADPKEDLTAAQVEQAMETLSNISALVAFEKEGPTSLKGAKTVQTVTNKFDIVIS